MSRHRLRCSAFATDMDVRFAEIAHQAFVRFEIDLLIAEENHAVRDNRIVHFVDLTIGQRPRQIDIADFGPDMRRKGRDCDGVVFPDLAHDAYENGAWVKGGPKLAGS